MSNPEPCRSYRREKSFCKDGFPQCPYCWAGNVGIYSKPLCLQDDPPEHQMKTFFTTDGQPKMYGRDT